MKPGDVYGYLTVIEVLEGGDVGHHDGAWVRVRCVCGLRQTIRARALRWRFKLCANVSCGCKAPEKVRAAVLMHVAKRGTA